MKTTRSLFMACLLCMKRCGLLAGLQFIGHLMIFANYDGGALNINVGQNK